MSSNMSSGERRWASAKRGMTVLGKVVVPKPINLPSQKSENHGLDPNVEIVPKGTLTWGSKSSSAWGSPNTDGGSPSHLSGRPSSGSGTRPSTASSDRAQDIFSNSRPSSASGALTTNQTSLASLRPRSAETRPGSSQLSRFAENSEHPAAWNAAGTAEKLGVNSSKTDEFSLTSGDFPTLGSGKENCGKKTDQQDASSYGRPGSSSGGAGTAKEGIGASGVGDFSASENVKNGNVNSWRRDNPPYADEGGRPSLEKWHGNPQTYPGPPPHYEAWHGPPVNNPQGGVWFRGPPGGPPYGNPVGPGGYPIEPFPYYRPQIPASGLPNSQPGQQPGAGPRGPHPKNGDMYRPHMPDPYIRPGIVRPGFYPGPVGYEGYYNPPMGFCGPNGPNERDVPYMGMPAGPHAYNRYPVQGAPEPGNHHGRSGGYGPPNQSQMGEPAESGHPMDTNRGPYKVLLKHDGWDRRNEEHRVSSWEDDDFRSDRNKEVERDLRKEVGEEATFQIVDKLMDETSGKKLESESLILSKDPQPLPASPKDSSLIRKIEGLNAKARASDGRNESTTVSDSERQNNKVQASTKAKQQIKESGGGSVHPERTPAVVIVNPVSHEGVAFGGDKNLDLPGGAVANISRKPTQSRADHHGRGRINTQELDGRQNKPLISQPPVVVPAVHLVNSNFHPQDHHRSVEPSEHSGARPHGKSEDQSVLPMFDRSDTKEQRAKMKELAKQRTKQLQDEEEERTKRQMAKAQAKLEELNKRTQASEEPTQTQQMSSTGVVQNNKQDGESPKASRRFGPQSSKPNLVAQSNENYAIGADKGLSSGEQSSEAPKSVHIEPPTMPTQQQEVKGASSAPNVHETNVSKQKRTGSKQKQPTSSTEAPKPQADVVENVTASLGVVQSGRPNLPATTISASAETSVLPRKKSSKNGKNKQKNEDKSASSSSSSSVVPKENLTIVSLETGQPKAPQCQPDPSAGAVHANTVSRDASEQNPTSPNEDSHGRGNSHWKPQQQSRRTPRNQQSNRPSEKFHGGDAVVWAPVRSQPKPEIANEAIAKNVVVDDIGPPVKSDNQAPNNSKNKRAEMERYVPKPVAKEMAQQGGINHNPVPPIVNQTTTDDSVAGANYTGPQVPENSQNKMGISTGSKNGNNRHNKQQQGKAHGSWRQRGPTESTNAQGFSLDGSSYSTNVTQNVQKSVEIPQPQKPEVTASVRDQEKCSDEWNDWGISDDYVEPVPVPSVKDQGSVASRGNRHASKGHRGSGNSRDHDQKRTFGDESDKNYSQSSNSETMRQIDQSAGSKENRGDGERLAPHWQPKSQALPTNTQRGNRHNSGQNAGTEDAWPNKPDTDQHNWVSPLTQTHSKDHDQPISGNVEQVPNIRHQEPRRERKTAPPKSHISSQNQGPSNPVEPEPANSDPRQEQRSSSGYRRNDNNSNNQKAHFSHSHETHEPRGDWNYSGQDNKQHNPPPNRERPRQGPRYEYQPVGPSHNSKPNHFEGPKEGTEHSGGRGRGRGQSHSRRGGGNFCGRQSGLRVDAAGFE